MVGYPLNLLRLLFLVVFLMVIVGLLLGGNVMGRFFLFFRRFVRSVGVGCEKGGRREEKEEKEEREQERKRKRM